MTERITRDMLDAQLVRTNKALNDIAKLLDTIGHLSEDLPRDSLELQRGYGGVQIVRADTGNPLTKYGTKREAYNALEMMRKTVDLLNGY